jgi:ribulose-phosphate 3-epimerase
MAVITPTITTNDKHEYRAQMELIARFSEGVHLDFADGVFAPSELLSIEHAWRSDDLITHIHVMYQDPMSVIDDIIALESDLVVLHVESENVKEALELLSENGTRTGIALLAESTLQDIEDLDLDGLFDHVLVFGGHLGFQGGKADLTHLEKIATIKNRYPDVEIGWDGGVNDQNLRQIVDAGVDVVNVGGYIKNAEKPQKAYETLVNLLS